MEEIYRTSTNLSFFIHLFFLLAMKINLDKLALNILFLFF